MTLRGQRFIEASFDALLGRAPDPEGLAYYQDRLARGVDRLDILRDLRASAEAQIYNAKIEGLSNALSMKKATRLPIFGSIFCFAIYGYSKRALIEFNILAERVELALSGTWLTQRAEINSAALDLHTPSEQPHIPNLEQDKDGLVEAPNLDERNLLSLPRRSLVILRSIS